MSAAANAARSASSGAGGEQLLELVDGDHEPAARRRVARRARSSAASGWAPGRRSAIAQPRCRGGRRAASAGSSPAFIAERLAAAGRPDDAEQRRARQPRDHLGDEPLATEEDVGVVDLEAGEALERAASTAAGARLGARSPPAARRRRWPGRPPPSAAARARSAARSALAPSRRDRLVARPATRRAVDAPRARPRSPRAGAEPARVAGTRGRSPRPPIGVERPERDRGAGARPSAVESTSSGRPATARRSSSAVTSAGARSSVVDDEQRRAAGGRTGRSIAPHAASGEPAPDA